MYVPLRHTHPNTLAHTGTQLLFRWGMHVFKMFDTDINGSLDSKELANALKKLPKTRPFNLPPGTKMMTIDDLINTLDSDGNGSVSQVEWISNLNKCVGLAQCLADNLDAQGNLPGFEGSHLTSDTPDVAQ
mmetsp:Transcript_44357/g.65033  ORF Transcript_44357/g.65033 Transcript_44357/m.65033 type:complete len:131 (+) Transcript_44357:1-393(+)